MQNDEYLWMQRGLSYVTSFSSLNLKSATISSHPGIIPSILIGASILFFEKGISVHSMAFFDPTFAARLPIVIIGSITPILMFILLRKIIPEKIAVLASLFIALDPVHIAYSRIAHVDAVLTLPFTICIITYFISEQNNSIYWKFISGIFFGLTILTKLTGFLILPILLIYKLLVYFNKSSFKDTTLRNIISKYDIFSFFIGIAIYILLYPKMWDNPISVFSVNTQLISTLVETSQETGNFWAGRAVSDPPAYYYIILLFIQSNEVLLLSVICGTFFLFKEVRTNKNKLCNFYILIFCILIIYIGALSISGKKIGIRYILPMWPFIGIVGAYGIFELIKKSISFFKFKVISENLVSFVIGFMIIIFLLLTDFSYSPNYTDYFNSLIGGPSGAKNFVTIDGQSSAPIKYIQSIAGNNKTIAVVGPDQLVTYYYGGKIADDGRINGGQGVIGRSTSFFESINWRTADYLVIYLGYKQVDPEYSAVKWADSQVPLFTEIRNGAEMSWVYQVPESLKKSSYFEDFRKNQWEKDKYLSYGVKTSNGALVPSISNESVYLIYLFKFNNFAKDIYLNVTGMNRYAENSITVLVSNDGVKYKKLIEYDKSSFNNVVKSSNIAEYGRESYVWIKFEMYYDKMAYGKPYILDFSIYDPLNNSKISPINESDYMKSSNNYYDDFSDIYKWKKNAYNIYGIIWSNKVDLDGGALYPEYKNKITKLKYKFIIDSKKSDYPVMLKVIGTRRDMRHNISVLVSADDAKYKIYEFNSTIRDSLEEDITNYTNNKTVWIEFRLYRSSEGENVPRINEFYIGSSEKDVYIYPVSENNISPNLVKEYSFESYEHTDSTPIVWSFAAKNGAYPSIDASGSDGNYSFKCEVKDSTGGDAELSQLINLSNFISKNNSEYVFEVSYKQSGSGNSNVTLQWLNENGTEEKTDLFYLNYSSVWKEFSERGAVPSNVTQLKIFLRHKLEKGDKGVVWFDGVKLFIK